MTSEREWHLVDARGQTTPATISSYFKIYTPPKTDIWRPSPDEDRFDAPYIYTRLKSSEFKSISVMLSADWKTLYDQGGLVILWPAAKKEESRWIKFGIEYFTGKPLLGVVGCDRFSDWSVCPLPIATATHATLEAVREGTTLWIYLVFNMERRPLREVKWAFLEDREAKAEMRVGTYAAKPTPEEDDAEKGLEVIFRDLKLETVT
ncbi:uncharacterized protein LTR77_004323 [Saxophila tyrrhenica]|uniref:Uncharacterized protein n=1 Tax=Saxophila tyrrhenica TaxID=1690608 RepID=A0AAV9PCM2_9PEZI|nr:hypothetical protein LTR77_004323 [Saxophila tyrrhenica]